MPCSGADVRSDGSSVLSVPGPQDDPGNPARLTPSYYLLSGENPGSWGVCGHSSTTFLHRVIFGVLARFREGLGGPGSVARRLSLHGPIEPIGTSARRASEAMARMFDSAHRALEIVCQPSSLRLSKVRQFAGRG